ncbi:putative tRNA pseudouridine synthase Pus10 [Hyposmocoma kahamanoa]|uniref:putative tRNA pseudouridine synthase Pus10 n=1 Tax=Hyposmocoma kahamanoa TaxID=1477025 RepID=UPI000E6D886A|nr:putative tRNA pseudouridine synthase Pus10 [Hyposmocoma kahamanoa]
MNSKGIVQQCKALGCCDACCLRFIGIRKDSAYAKCHEFVLKYLDKEGENYETITQCDSANGNASITSDENEVTNNDPPQLDPAHGIPSLEVPPPSDISEPPPAKKCKQEVCTSCLGILQENTWAKSLNIAKEVFDKKGYDCESFAAALSSPMAILIREKAIVLCIKEKYPNYDASSITSLKESWKFTFAERLATHIGRRLDSGAVASLLVTLNMEYPDDLQELEILKTLSPSLFEARSKQARRFITTFTRPAVEQALRDVTAGMFGAVEGWRDGVPRVAGAAECASAVWTRLPMYLGGRYIKLSRCLPQTPWLVGDVEGGGGGLTGSVQQTLFEPLMELLGMTPEEAESRLKLISAGREDVDVRCLGEGRPFAIEITDPRRELTAEELQQACDVISKSGNVIVKSMVYVSKDELTQLKKGEETKCKTYEALCIKLGHSANDEQSAGNEDTPIAVTPADIELLNTYCNTEPSEGARMLLSQKTPIRVLHRRPLLDRKRRILELTAYPVPGKFS